jgi:2-oxopent-4-enoate/cis-2-oxohex-4-enoate hydratase
MVIHKNGEQVADGMGSAVQGHPAQAVAWLANTLGAYGIELGAGEVILSGSLAPLLPASAGDYFVLSMTGLGQAEIHFSR